MGWTLEEQPTMATGLGPWMILQELREIHGPLCAVQSSGHQLALNQLSFSLDQYLKRKNALVGNLPRFAS